MEVKKTMKKVLKQIVSFCVALAMCATALPVSAFGLEDVCFLGFEREGKRNYNDNMNIFSRVNAEEMYNIWWELGRPFPK